MSDETTRVILELQGKDSGATATVSGVASSVVKLTTVMGTLAAVGRIAAGAFDMAEEGAKLQRLADSGSEVARQLGGDMDLIIQKVKEASRGTVSEMDIIASSNKAMMLGLGADADQLANLMEIAAFRGRAMGVDTTQAFDDIVRGIGRSSPMILDNLGIVVNANETYTKYAEKIGKSANELTKAEKTQALLNRVLEEGNNLLDEAGGLADDNASAFEKLHTQMEDNRNRAKSLAADGISPLVKYLADSTEAMNNNAAALERMDEGLYKDYQAHKVLTPEMQSLIAGAERGRAMMEYYGVSIEGVGDSASDTVPDIEALSKANEDLVNNAIKITDANADYQKSQEDITAQIAELQAEKLTYYSWETDKIQETQDKIDDLSAKYSENAEEFRAAMEEKFAMMAVEKIAMSDGVAGFSEAEYEKARVILETTDIATAAAFEQAQAQDILANAVANGRINAEEFGSILTQVMADGVVSVGEVQAAIEGLPSEKTITLNIQTNYSPETQAAMELFAAGEKGYSASPTKKQHAAGGSFLIPMGYGNEGFAMGNGDTASGGERVTITPRGQNPNADIIAALYATRINEAALARNIVEGVLAASR